MELKKLTSGQIIEGVKKRNNKVLTSVYKDVFPVVSRYVVNHGGSKDEAKDVFQESIIIAFRQVQQSTFELKTSFEAYVFGIARLIWLKMLRSKNIHERNIHLLEEPEHSYNSADLVVDEEIQLMLYRKHYLRLGPECQKILTRITEEIPYADIAKELGYKSEKIVRTKKYKCKEFLVQMIKNDPDYLSLID